ncbi:aminopeptidase [Chloroflexota bacterium]
MFELMKGIRSIFEACMAVKPGEQWLVLADDDGRSMWIGQLVMNVISSMGSEAVLVIITPREIAEQEPPASVAAAMRSVDAVVRVSEKKALVHSDARKEATAAGVRYYSIMGGIPIEDLKQGVSAADIQLIKEKTESLAQRLTQASVARVTSQLGTNITLGLTGREGIALHPMSHVAAGLPYYAEAAIAPVEGTAEGIIVADLAVVQWGYRLREPLRITVKAGKVVDISSCAQEADRLRKIIAMDENASNIAELGIGTSHIIPWEIHGTRRDAARIGTAHIGIGRNNDIGGKTWSRIHVDSLIDKAIVDLDDYCVLREGSLLI